MRVIIDNKKIGENIKNLRLENNMNLDELSSVTDIAKNILINYELGKKQLNIKNLIIVCNYFKIKIDDLVSYQII